MTDSTENPLESALQSLIDFNRIMTQQLLGTMGQQTSQSQEIISTLAKLPLPKTEDLVSLQQDYLHRHGLLWSSLLSRSQGGKTDSPLPEPVIAPEPGDRRFSDPAWAESPIYAYLHQLYLLNSDCLRKAIEAIPLEDDKLRARMHFMTRQYIDALSPANFFATNPEFIDRALKSKGQSITQGIQNLLGDLEKGRISMTDESVFEIGRNLAITPGAVVHENELMQLIQYAPLTEKVAQKPLLIVPPCINKFYILDLQPDNSLVRFVVEQGFSVFLVSWKNVGQDEAHYGWDDYLQKGPIEALSVVQAITRVRKPNVLGFCVGGTLLSSALAVLYGRGEDPVESLTLMTTFLDFAEPGELGCFIDEASVAAREAAIGNKGLLRGQELASIFSALRANDLIWQYVSGNYLKGTQPKAFDLLYWNADATNLPGPFATWYLRNMYLENKLRIPGQLSMLDTSVDLGKIKAPAYLLATREDHIVPWRSAYLSRALLGGETSFVLGASGHIAGAINPSSRNRRSYWLGESVSASASAQEWLSAAEEQPGSWWNHWIKWLKERGGKQLAARTRLGNERYSQIEPAPGRYVRVRA